MRVLCVGSGFAAPRMVLRVCAGALCHGGTSESVRMLREMAIEEVGQELALGCYILVVSGRGWD